MSQTIEKCYVNYLGCEKRKLDTQSIWEYLKKNKYTLTFDVKQADAIVFVTCGFCEKYEDWSISKMKKIYQKKQLHALFIICGCLTSINPKRLQENFPDAIHIKTRNLEELDSIFQPMYPMQDIPDTNITIFDKQIAKYESERPKTKAQLQYEEAKKGYKIRINWGCLGNCAFCVTRYAEQKLLSKPLDTILTEFKNGLQKKHRTFFLTGGDTGAYGQDIQTNIVHLLQAMFQISGNYIFHFHDFGVHWFYRYKKELQQLFENNREHIGCFCLPIQSGSNRILKIMHRPYLIENIVETLIKFKQAIPEIMIGTHFITGFPGETEQDFQQSVQVVQQLPLDFCNVFPYTDHASAESYHFPDKVPEEIILQRYQILFQTFEAKIENSQKEAM